MAYQEERFRLSADETQLSSYLSLYAQQAGVQSVRIDLDEGSVRVCARLLLGSEHHVGALLDPRVCAGKPCVHIRELSWDGHRLPRIGCALMQRALNDVLADASTHITVEEILLTRGTILVAGGRN